MRYRVHSHRHALTILEEPQFREQWREILIVLDGISDEDLIEMLF